MAENLRYNIEGSWCYDNDEANCQDYGRLYTWDAAKKACPTGWHLPTREEWQELVRAVDPNAQLKDITLGRDGVPIFSHPQLKDIPLSEIRDNNNVAGNKLKTTGCWYGEGNGTDEFGFSALPGGLMRLKSRFKGRFSGGGDYGSWWTATERDADNAYCRSVGYFIDSLLECNDGKKGKKGDALSVRCVKD
jgi:uncharacterized protein (TIGR02145 family)